MTNTYSLDQLVEDLDKQYAPLKLTLGDGTFVLRSLLRVPDSQRTSVLGAMDKLKPLMSSDEDDEDDWTPEEVSQATEALFQILGGVTADGKGPKLLEFINGDVVLGMKIMELWTEATQPGEAPSSPDSSTDAASN